MEAQGYISCNVFNWRLRFILIWEVGVLFVGCIEIVMYEEGKLVIIFGVILSHYLFVKYLTLHDFCTIFFFFAVKNNNNSLRATHTYYYKNNYNFLDKLI